MRDVSTSPQVRSASIARQYPGATGDAFLSGKALMKHSSIPIAGLPDDLVSKDDEGLFAFTNTLRISVKAKVAAEQHRGLSLSEIVVQVREMVRLAEEEAQHPRRFPARAFRAISRQAVAWCFEAYRPLVVTAGKDVSPRPNAADTPPVPIALDRAVQVRDRLPSQSLTYED